MTSAKPHLGPNKGKRKLSTLELLLVSGFVLFLAYMSLEPLVLPVSARPEIRTAAAVEPGEPAQVAVPAEMATQPVADQKIAVSAVADTKKPAFVVTPDSTILDRIAPVATVIIEAPAMPATTAEALAAPASVAPVAAVDTAKAEVAPTPVAIAVPATPVVAETSKQTGGTRFEISDATGVDGFGKNLAQSLEESGIVVAKVASVAAGKQRRTVIVYRDGFEDAARRLGKMFTAAPALVKNASPRDSAEAADVKLILGTVAAREKSLLASNAGLPTLSQGRVARSH